MAGFGIAQYLGPLPASGRVVGLEPGGDDDRVLVTRGERNVTLYKVSKQHALGSWSLRQGQAISAPAVLCATTGELAVVKNTQTLQLWKESDVNLEKVFRCTVTHPIHRLLPGPWCGGAAVLFTCGAVHSLDTVLSSPLCTVTGCLLSGEVIRWCKVVADRDKHLIVFVSEKENALRLHVAAPGDAQAWNAPWNVGGKPTMPLAQDAILQREDLVLISLCSDSKLYKSEVLASHRNPESLPSMVMSTQLMELPGWEPSSRAVSMALLGDCHVAVASLPESSAAGCLSLWNTKFKTLHASLSISNMTAECGELRSLGGNLFLPLEESLFVVPWRGNSSSLADALGRQPTAEEDCFAVVDWATSQVETAHGKEFLKNSCSTEGMDAQIKSIASFIERGSTTKAFQELSRLVSGTIPKALHPMLADLTRRVIVHLQDKPGTAAHNILVHLVNSHCLSYSSCPDVFRMVLTARDLALLHICLRTFPDIPECRLVSCINLFLSVTEAEVEKAAVNCDEMSQFESTIDIVPGEERDKPDVSLTDATNEEEEEDSDYESAGEKSSLGPSEQVPTCPVSYRRATLLNAALMIPYSSAILLPCLKLLSADHALCWAIITMRPQLCFHVAVAITMMIMEMIAITALQCALSTSEISSLPVLPVLLEDQWKEW
uniref:nucleolar protein 11 isoform X2 n=1 Tax=Myxine glutinosa TaxID=7769 RepID=UPI00358FFCBD